MSDIVVVSERRRSWPEELKRKLLAEAEQPGENICRVARRHDIEPAQMYQWRKKFRYDAKADVAFLPVEIGSSVSPTKCSEAPPPDTRLEIACKNGRHLFVPLDIDEKKLGRLVSALEKA